MSEVQKIKKVLTDAGYEVGTPQFTRMDGVKVLLPAVMDFEELRKLDREARLKAGMRKWDETLWLFPGEWYPYIPAGTEIVDIAGAVEKFVPGETDKDIRFGMLAYGFVYPLQENA